MKKQYYKVYQINSVIRDWVGKVKPEKLVIFLIRQSFIKIMTEKARNLQSYESTLVLPQHIKQLSILRMLHLHLKGSGRVHT